MLSNSTRRIDETEKRLAYMQIETLEEYVLIAQDFVQIEVIRKSEGWKSAKYFLGDEVIFTSIGLTLSVEEIYDGVDNADMVEWLKQKGTNKIFGINTFFNWLTKYLSHNQLSAITHIATSNHDHSTTQNGRDLAIADF